MTDETKPKRRANGTFAAGSSGNEGGRPPRDNRIPSPSEIRDMFYDVGEFKMPVSIGGKKMKLNLLQANYLTLGVAGAGGNQNAAMLFITKMQQVSEQERKEMARLLKRLDGLSVPAYQLETDPAKRAAKKAAWIEYIQEATGERKSSSRGLGKKRQRKT